MTCRYGSGAPPGAGADASHPRDGSGSALVEVEVLEALVEVEVLASRSVQRSTRAQPREGKKRLLRSPGFMGGLAGGRVRSRMSRGIPKKRSCSLNIGSRLLE